MRKYGLPPNHRLFTSQSAAEMRLEIYEDVLARRDAMRQQLKAGQFGSGADAAEARRALVTDISEMDEMLGDVREDFDPVTAQWEADFAAGRTPDFTRRVRRA